MQSSVSVIHDEKKRATIQISLDRFSKKVRVEPSKEPEAVPSTSGMREIAAYPLVPIAADPLALPSPTSSLLQSVTLLAGLLNASPCIPAGVLYYCIFQGTIRF